VIKNLARAEQCASHSDFFFTFSFSYPRQIQKTGLILLYTEMEITSLFLIPRIDVVDIEIDEYLLVLTG
jgi:hypothetical protein